MFHTHMKPEETTFSHTVHAETVGRNSAILLVSETEINQAGEAEQTAERYSYNLRLKDIHP